MNTSKLKLALLLCLLCFAGTVHARIVTLTVGGSKTNDSLTIGTNEVLTVLTGEGDDQVLWEKDGFSFGSFNDSYFWANEFNSATASARGKYIAYSLTVAGPATINLRARNTQESPSYLTVQVKPEQFPPDKAVIVPEGSGANIVLESSTNLIHWTDATPGLYTNRTGNLFFRIRADRIP